MLEPATTMVDSADANLGLSRKLPESAWRLLSEGLPLPLNLLVVFLFATVISTRFEFAATPPARASGLRQ